MMMLTKQSREPLHNEHYFLKRRNTDTCSHATNAVRPFLYFRHPCISYFYSNKTYSSIHIHAFTYVGDRPVLKSKRISSWHRYCAICDSVICCTNFFAKHGGQDKTGKSYSISCRTEEHRQNLVRRNLSSEYIAQLHAEFQEEIQYLEQMRQLQKNCKSYHTDIPMDMGEERDTTTSKNDAMGALGSEEVASHAEFGDSLFAFLEKSYGKDQTLSPSSQDEMPILRESGKPTTPTSEQRDGSRTLDETSWARESMLSTGSPLSHRDTNGGRNALWSSIGEQIILDPARTTKSSIESDCTRSSSMSNSGDDDWSDVYDMLKNCRGKGS